MAAKNIQRRLTDLIKRMKSGTDNDPGSTVIVLAEIVRDMHVASRWSAATTYRGRRR